MNDVVIIVATRTVVLVSEINKLYCKSWEFKTQGPFE